MFRFLCQRALASVPVLVGVATLVFLMIHFIPGDPVDLMLGESASVADRDQLRQHLGLHLPLLSQYFAFWRHIVDGSWGDSLSYGRKVLPLILEVFPSTCALALASLLVACMFSVPLGVWAARRAGTLWDTGATGFALLGMSLPIFVTAPLAVLFFSIHLRWLPVAGSESPWHLVLPTLCLGAGLSGMLTRIVRTSVLETLGEDFVRTARAKGLSERAVLFKHALRNALVPVVTVIGNMLGGLLAGAVLTETLFDWEGIGKLFYSAFQARDYPLVQGIVLWIAASYVVIGILVDALYSAVDPRIRLEA